MLDTTYQSLALECAAHKQSTQMMLETDIIVPDVKADIDTILRLEANIVPNEEKVTEGRVSFKGVLLLHALYQAKRAEKPVHTMDFELPFEDFITMEGLDKDSQVALTYHLNVLEHKLINDRKISVKAVITVTAQKQNRQEKEIVVSLADGKAIECLMGTLSAMQTVANKKDRFVIKEELTLAAGKPNIMEVLQCGACVSGKDVRAGDGKVVVRANLIICLLYIGDSDESMIEIFEKEIPFTGTVECKDVKEGMQASADIHIEDTQVMVQPDGDGEDRILQPEVTIGVDISVTDNIQMQYLEDAYSLNEPLVLKREKITYQTGSSKNCAQFSVHDTLAIDGKYPEMMQVEKVWGEAAVDDVSVHNGKIAVDGVVNMEVLYVAPSDATPVCVVPISVPFSQEIETKELKEPIHFTAMAQVDDISFNMLSPREVELRATLNFDIAAWMEEQVQVVTGAAYSEEGTAPLDGASIVIYVVQKGDSLWKIAKKYGTTIEELLSMNDIENPDKIYPGEKLLVLKKPVAECVEQ